MALLKKPMKIGETTYEAAWNSYRRRRLWFIFAFVGYTPCCAIRSFILTQLLHSEIPVYALAGLWMTGLLVAWLRMIFFCCPRCGKRFFWQDAVSKKVFATKCVHCGLEKWENSTS
jgi:predicted RNA-binding Zn-ribbon protein involved in translation (DUF1610 family)